MKFPLVCLGAAAALTLAACGDRATDMSVPDIPDLPLQTPLQAYQTTIHVGADVAAPADALQQAALHGETRVSYGSVQDGIGAAEVIAYRAACKILIDSERRKNTQASNDVGARHWRDFDRDHGRISVGTASDSVFSSNFGRVWPHRLSRSAATVMAKETSRTRSAER